MLQQGIRLSGENKNFFVMGRIKDLQSQVGSISEIREILDFGCGNGETAFYLAECFTSATVTGVDTSKAAIQYANNRYSADRIKFRPITFLNGTELFDICYINGVFHHINLNDRHSVIKLIYDSLRPGGQLALFENNPWNFGARMVMRRIPFDRDAIMLSPPEARKLINKRGNWDIQSTRFLFYFPRPLALFRRFEGYLVNVPLGAQYYVLATKR